MHEVVDQLNYRDPALNDAATAQDVPSVFDADAWADDVAGWAARVPPGSAAVMALADVDPRRLSDGGRIDALIALERQMAWLLALQHRLMAVIMAGQPDRSVDGLDKNWVREEVAAALRISGPAAGARLQLADQLSQMPETLALLEGGVITGAHARALAEAVCGLDSDDAAEVQGRVLAQAGGQSLATFRRSVHQAVAAVTAVTATAEHERAVAQRRVVCRPAPDGMSELWALLPADGATALITAIGALADTIDPRSADPRTADPRSGDPRTADPRSANQRRADALVQLAVAALNGVPACSLTDRHSTADDHEGGDRAGNRPHLRTGMRPRIQVTVALSTLLELDDQSAELDGHGPIPAALARVLANDPTGTWHRLVTDPLGRLIDYGRTTYRPPAAVARHVIARDRTCRFPQCGRSALRAELDHCHAWSQGGATSADNLHSLCARHHHLKHDAGWTTHRDPVTGTTYWTAPTGHRYRKHLDPYPSDTTTSPPHAPGPPHAPDAPRPDAATPDAPKPPDPARLSDRTTSPPPF